MRSHYDAMFSGFSVFIGHISIYLVITIVVVSMFVPDAKEINQFFAFLSILLLSVFLFTLTLSCFERGFASKNKNYIKDCESYDKIAEILEREDWEQHGQELCCKLKNSIVKIKDLSICDNGFIIEIKNNTNIKEIVVKANRPEARNLVKLVKKIEQDFKNKREKDYRNIVNAEKESFFKELLND